MVRSKYGQYVVGLMLLTLVGTGWWLQSGNAYDFFTDTNQWVAYDPGVGGFIGGGYDAKGFGGGGYDGRYIYLAGKRSGASNTHGDIMRYEVGQQFATQGSWEIFSPTDEGVGTNPVGFSDAIFDGRYMYFVPNEADGAGNRSGEVLRYDTQGDFDDILSWETFLLTGLNADAKGYYGGVFDGRYLYLTPYRDDNGAQGRFVRFDTQGDFTDSADWELYSPGAVGMSRAVFDGRYVYYGSGDDSDTSVVRYDTQGDFALAGSWATYDVNYNTEGLFFDGTHLYLSGGAQDGGGYGGQVYRYAVSEDFTVSGSWQVMDVETVLAPVDARGYSAITSDGRYLYFAPYRPDEAGVHGEVLRYDRQGAFTTASSWTTLSLGDEAIVLPANEDTEWTDMIWDGTHVTLVPGYKDSTTYGEVVRFAPGYTTGWLYPRVTLSEKGINATNVQYDIIVRPTIPWTDGTVLEFNFPEEYDSLLDAITATDVQVSATNLDTATVTIDTVLRRISVELTTDIGTSIVSDIALTIGDGASGGLNDIVNPATAGVYGVDISVYTATDDPLETGLLLVEIDNSLTVNASIVQAVVLEIDQSVLRFSVDPAYNNGRDNSKYTILTVRSNAGEGYVIHGGLNDGDGEVQFKSGNGGTIPAGLGMNTIGFTAYNEPFDPLLPGVIDATHAFTSVGGDPVPAAPGGELAFAGTTNEQIHTIYYDVQVDFLTPAGIYDGVISYTVVGDF